jgi:hypothetical protein
VPPGDVTLLGADWTVTLLAGDQLRLLSRDDGAVTVAAALPAGAADQPPPQETAVDAVVLVWARGRLIAADSASRTLLWQRPARGLPAGKTDGKDAAAVPQVLVPEDGGFVLRDLSTGAELGRATVTDLPPGGTSTPVGPVVVYRLADRVLGFR